MELSTVPDWISALASLATACAAVAAAWQGIRSLSAWRHEAIGRRKFEVAEQTLTLFYQMKEIIHSARAPFVREVEMIGDDGKEISNWSVHIKRFWSRPEDVARFRVQRHSFVAVFGTENEEPFDLIEKAISEFIVACEMLADPMASDYDRELLFELRRDACRTPTNDRVSAKVNEAVAKMESFCRPVIAAAA